MVLLANVIFPVNDKDSDDSDVKDHVGEHGPVTRVQSDSYSPQVITC